ncbi:MAG: hypothetical protein N2645_07350 [Clostridia bacterium]|nr:hypothetical protein [Clostridia bacterium]
MSTHSVLIRLKPKKQAPGGEACFKSLAICSFPEQDVRRQFQALIGLNQAVG